MSSITENVLDNTTNCCEDNVFSDELIIWIYNEHIYKDFNLPCVVYLCILVIFGIFGNSLVIYIYGFKFKRTNAHFFILSLAIFDNTFCFGMILEVFDKRFPMYSGNYSALCKITRLTEVFSSGSSSLLLVCIAVDRYYKICEPFKRFSYKTARKSLIICIFLGVILSWPMVLFHGPETVPTGVKGVVGKDCADDDNFKESILPGIYFGFLGLLNITVIIILVVLYIRIFRAILTWQKEDNGESMPSSPVSTISTTHSISKVITWLNTTKHKIYRDTESSNDNNETNKHSSQQKLSCSEDGCNQSNTSLFIQNGVHGKQKTNHNNNQSSTPSRRYSTFSIHSGPVSLKNSRIITTNTVSFAIVTIIYILTYLPTIFVEIFNASGVYNEETLSIPTRRLLVILNVMYFFNSISNQFVYSVINPAFRHQVKNMIRGQ